jgi:RNA polymerase sigma-32 factor
MTFKAISREKEHELVKLAQANDREAWRTLIEYNAGILHGESRKHWNINGGELDDYYQAALVGLMTAIRSYNPDFGTRLLTHAVWNIKAALMKEGHKQSTVRWATSEGAKAVSRWHSRVVLEMDAEGVPYTFAEVARRIALKVPKTQVTVTHVEQFAECRRPLSLQAFKINNEDDPMTVDLKSSAPLQDEELECLEEREIAKEVVEYALSKLNKREQVVVRERLMEDEPRTLEEIGKELGMTREGARQLLARATEKLRRAALTYKRRIAA